MTQFLDHYLKQIPTISKERKKKSASYNEMTFTKNRGECDVFTTKYFSYY